MIRRKRKQRVNHIINAGSMADIAFLLLIFFLVTTQIKEDAGLMTKLPPWRDKVQFTPIDTRNLLSININAKNELMVRDQIIQLTQLKDIAKIFLSNPSSEPDKAINIESAVISIKNDRATNYNFYLQVYDQLQAAYNELRNEYSLKNFGKNFVQLSKDESEMVKKAIPIVISDAESTNFGTE